MTEKQFRFGYWYTTHQLRLRKLAVVILIVVNAALWLPALYLSFRLFVLDGPRYARMLREFSVNLVDADALAAARPRPFEISQTVVFTSSANRTDFAAVVLNHNPRWYARVEYRFVGEGVATPASRGIIFPNQETVLPFLGFENPVRPREVRVEFTSVIWQKLSPHEIPDPERYLAEHLNFTVADAAYTAGPPARSSFSVTNNTAFGYWSVPAIVLLKRGQSITGVNAVTLSRFAAEETRQVDLTWFDSAAAGSTVDVRLAPDLFDPGNYLPPQR